jgi:aspartate racemase
MKTIGLLGGMSWQSTVPYYQTINRLVAQRLGGLHSARMIVYSVEFHEIEQLQHAGQWTEAGETLAGAARALEGAGAAFLVLATNTMHKVAPQLEAAVRIPLLHIGDATGHRVRSAGLRKVGLLATRFTMEQEFYRGRLQQRHGLEVLVPDDAQREVVHRIIYDELCQGEVLGASRERYQEVARDLVHRGAEGVILGCTEIGLLLRPGDLPVPTFDTAEIHAEAAVTYALS